MFSRHVADLGLRKKDELATAYGLEVRCKPKWPLPFAKQVCQKDHMNIKQLSAQTGVTERQIRHLVSKRIVPAPHGSRSHPEYRDEHVAAIRRYNLLRQNGCSPAAILRTLHEEKQLRVEVAPGVALVLDLNLLWSGAEVGPILGNLAMRLAALLSKRVVFSEQDGHWGATGVGDYQPVKLSSNLKEHVETELRSRGINSSSLDAFFETIGKGIEFFKSNQRLAEESKPSRVRQNLKAAISAALKLNGRINDLDGNSRRLLSRVAKDGVFSVYEDLGRVIAKLTRTKQLASSYPTAGRLDENNRVFLAADVAKAIRDHLGEEPTTTKEGLFESILGMALKEATGKDFTALHELVRKSLSYEVRREAPDGVVTYVSPYAAEHDPNFS